MRIAYRNIYVEKRHGVRDDQVQHLVGGTLYAQLVGVSQRLEMLFEGLILELS